MNIFFNQKGREEIKLYDEEKEASDTVIGPAHPTTIASSPSVHCLCGVRIRSLIDVFGVE
jgi:hypothetical protein